MHVTSTFSSISPVASNITSVRKQSTKVLLSQNTSVIALGDNNLFEILCKSHLMHCLHEHVDIYVTLTQNLNQTEWDEEPARKTQPTV